MSAEIKPRPTGYVDCIACGAVAFGHLLCGWCQRGAEEHNCDPDSVFEADFDNGNLGYWADAGERLAASEDANAFDGVRAEQE